MDDDPDADALSWGEGDRPDPRRRCREPAGRHAQPRPAPGTGSLLLVGYGVFAGVYLLYTIGWFAAVLRNTLTLAGLIPEIMYQFGEFLAIVAPALWLGAVLLLTRGAGRWCGCCGCWPACSCWCRGRCWWGR